MDKKREFENLLDMDVEIPNVVQKKAMDAFAHIKTETSSDETERRNKMNHSKKNSKSNNHKKVFKLLVGLAACFAILIINFGYSIYGQKNMPANMADVDVSNGVINNPYRFTIQAKAAELENVDLDGGETVDVVEGQAVPIAIGGFSDGWCMGSFGDSGVSYSFNLPFTCVGEDIETITYTINKGCFYIMHPENDGFIVSGVPASEEYLTEEYELNPGCIAEKFDSYTVNYDFQSGEKISVYLQDEIYDRPDLVELLNFDSMGLPYIKSQLELISGMMEDKIMTVKATFNDGTTEEYHLVFGASFVYIELGVEPERIVDGCSCMETIVCMVGKKDMDETTSVKSVVSEEDWDILKRVVKLGDDVVVEKQTRLVGPGVTEEENTWSGQWNTDREVIHITEENANLLGLHIGESVILDDSVENSGTVCEEYRYVVLSIPRTPEIIYGDEPNRYIGVHSWNGTNVQQSENADDISEKIEEPGKLSDEEMQFFSQWSSREDNYGFFLSSYTTCDYIEYDKVLYCGAGITPSSPWSEADLEAFSELNGGRAPETDVTFIRKSDLEKYVLQKTGDTLDEMVLLPLMYSPKTETYYIEHGDSNYMSYTCIDGKKLTDDEYELHLMYNIDTNQGQTSIVRIKKVGDDYQILSCLIQ